MKKKIKALLEEFKKFIAKGNILDLAVAVIIGAAFSKIVTSLVNDMVMPLITGALGGHSLADLSWVIKPEVLANDGSVLQPALSVKWGSFLQNIIDFLMIAVIVFSFVKIITAAKAASGKLHNEARGFIREYGKGEKIKAAPTEQSAQADNTEENKPSSVECLLAEIRDLLAEKQTEKEE
jgi:large conductance mechanosensitive channel